MILIWKTYLCSFGSAATAVSKFLIHTNNFNLIIDKKYLYILYRVKKKVCPLASEVPRPSLISFLIYINNLNWIIDKKNPV